MAAILTGHVDASTAYLVADYPYGFRLRCRIRYWLESNKRGVRFVSQTENPKTRRWNTPKAGTYAPVGCLYLDGEGHVQCATLNEYHVGDAAKVATFLRDFPAMASHPVIVAVVGHAVRRYAQLASGEVTIETSINGVRQVDDAETIARKRAEYAGTLEAWRTLQSRIATGAAA